MEQLIAEQRRYFYLGQTRPPAFRKSMLVRLERAVVRHEADLTRALLADLGKPPFEAYATEIGFSLSQLRFLARRVAAWSAPRRAPLSAVNLSRQDGSATRALRGGADYGAVNYPVQLTLAPWRRALAAGNCAVVKPSAYAPESSKALARMISEIFPRDMWRWWRGEGRKFRPSGAKIRLYLF
jgi:aldehyde dehydrogenase (NAD+)